MPTCREGHNSATADYCDECGAPIGAGGSPDGAALSPASSPAPVSGVSPNAGSAVGSGSGSVDEPCPICGTPRSGRFCEEDGYDFVLRPPVPAAAPPAPAVAAAEGRQAAGTPPSPVPGSPAGMVAVVEADRAYYDVVMAQHGPDAASITFPAVYPKRRVPLAGGQVLIGRHSTSRGLDPQIDLTGPPEDPGVSHLHAVLQQTPDGGWTITDPGSTNGTTLNDDPTPIEVDIAVPVRPGDRIHVGAWTTITLEPAGAR